MYWNINDRMCSGASRVHSNAQLDLFLLETSTIGNFSDLSKKSGIENNADRTYTICSFMEKEKKEQPECERENGNSWDSYIIVFIM